MSVTIEGRTYAAGSSPEIAPRFPGITWGNWPGSKAVPTSAMLQAQAMDKR